MDQVGIDAYVPAQMAVRVEKAGIDKGNRDFFSTFTLAVMAGVFIALGAVFFTYVIHDSTLSVGLTKLIGGFVFSLGLILVIITGAELFTGNNLIVMAVISRKITLGQLLNNWGIVFTGNFVGSLIVVFLILLTGMWTAGNASVGVTALAIADAKVDLTFWQALSKGILCNILVCLAVYLCFSGRSVTDKSWPSYSRSRLSSLWVSSIQLPICTSSPPAFSSRTAPRCWRQLKICWEACQTFRT